MKRNYPYLACIILYHIIKQTPYYPLALSEISGECKDSDRENKIKELMKNIRDQKNKKTTRKRANDDNTVGHCDHVSSSIIVCIGV